MADEITHGKSKESKAPFLGDASFSSAQMINTFNQERATTLPIPTEDLPKPRPGSVQFETTAHQLAQQINRKKKISFSMQDVHPVPLREKIESTTEKRRRHKKLFG